MNEARSDARTSILIALLALVVGGLGIYHVEALKGKVVAAEMTAKMATEQALAANSRADDLINEVSELRIELAHAQLEMENAGSSQNLGATFEIPTVKAFFETSLASNISSSATSFTLTSATDKEGNTLASSTYAFVIDEGTANEEMVLADCTGTSCTNVTRGISVVSGTTSVATLMKSHRRGASVKITDGPSLMILSRILSGVGNLPNVLKYGASTADCAAAQEICDYDFVTNLAFNGASVINASTVAKGLVELATQLESASSTATGGSGAALVPANSTATSTYNSATAALRLIMTQNNGFIDQGFLPATTTKQFAFSTSTVNGIALASTTQTTFNASGTWTKPTSGTIALIEAWGAGGSGGSSNNHAGTGGGGGGYAWRVMRVSDLGSTETVTIGAGGTGVTNGNVGNAGGNTTFGSHLTAYGGGAGYVCTNDTNDFPASGGGGGSPIAAGTSGASDGDSTPDTAVGYMIIAGNPRTGIAGTDGLYGASGGGCTSGAASSGGAAYYGGGGGGGAHNGGSEGSGGASTFGGAGGQGQDDTNGTAGTQPAGGGGANSSGGTSGAGADGRVRVTVF